MRGLYVQVLRGTDRQPRPPRYLLGAIAVLETPAETIQDIASVRSGCIDWKAFKAWKGAYPTFAARYFGGGTSYKAGEFKSAYGTTGTDGALQYIFPIQASQGGGTGNYYGQTYYDQEGTTGYA